MDVHDAIVAGRAGAAQETSELRDALLRERRARERAEEALLLTRFAVDNAAEPMFTLSARGRILDANATAARHYGYCRAELLDLKIDDLEEPGADGRFETVWPGLDDGGSAVVESSHLTRAGACVPVEVSYARFRHGGQAYCCAAVRDLSERRRAQLALRESEQRLRTLVDNLPAAVTLKGRDGRYLLANPEFERWFGGEPGSTLGLTCQDLLEAETARDYVAADERILAGAPSAQWEADLRTAEGHERVVSVSKFPLLGGEGEVVAVGSIALDITRIKRIERALRESEERFDLAVRGSSDGLWDRPDLGGDRLWWSPRVFELLGYETGAFAPTHARLLGMMHPSDRARFADARRRHFVAREPFDVEYRLRTRSGEYRWFRSRGQAIWDETGRARRMSGSIQDVTATKEAEEQRLAAVRAQRDALVREVHHRIKNHLQGVMGLLTQYAGREPGVADVADRIRTQVNSIAVVHGLQGRPSDGTLWLASIVNAILQAARGVYSHRFDAELDRGAMAGVELAEQEAVPIALVINELVTNALKHCDPSATDGRAVRLIPFVDGRQVGLRIVNAGARLPAGFDFAAGRGLGTGLQLVRALLPRQGVELRFESAEFQVAVEVLLEEPVVRRKRPDPEPALERAER